MDNCKNIKQPTISVIIPVYQAEKTLERCVVSILKQSFSDFEIILINDGSTDRSGEIADRYAEQDFRVKVIHKNNGGVSSARNIGLDKAIGTYIVFIDADDELKKEYLNRLLLFMINTKCDCIIGGCTQIDTGGSCTLEKVDIAGIYGREIWVNICKNSTPYGYVWGKLFRKDIIREHELFFRQDMYAQEDLDFCLSYYSYCNNIAIIDNTEYLYYYVPGKRKPPVWDFISNQLKLARLAKERMGDDTDAEKAVRNRIELLLYTYLYDAEQSDTFDEAIFHLKEVNGLKDYLKTTRVVDTKSRIANWYVKEKYSQIYHYLHIRNKMRDIVRVLRKR